MRVVAALMVLGVAACEPDPARQAVRSCEAYARAFAEGAATRCGRGGFTDNTAAFKVAADVGVDCERVTAVRDRTALDQTCLPWVSEQAGCELFDDPQAYLSALPEACRNQLQRD